MGLKKMHWLGMIAGILIILGDVILFLEEERMFLFLLGLGVGIALLPFVMGVAFESKREQKINDMFLEFSRSLAESVATGTPVSKAIINAKNKNYGELSDYIKKLANQIELGIPVYEAMQTFATDINVPMIKRATALIREAERAGGEIDYILESTAKSISEVEKLKKEKNSAIYSLAIQGYIIFFIFIGIIVVMQFKILPLTTGISGLPGFASGNLQSFERDIESQKSSYSAEDFTRPFIYLLLAQGFFVGLIIGKISEGSIKKGIKHSFILMITAFLTSTGANLFITPPAPV